jgi:hypothetical protein
MGRRWRLLGGMLLGGRFFTNVLLKKRVRMVMELSVGVAEGVKHFV